MDLIVGFFRVEDEDIKGSLWDNHEDFLFFFTFLQLVNPSKNGLYNNA